MLFGVKKGVEVYLDMREGMAILTAKKQGLAFGSPIVVSESYLFRQLGGKIERLVGLIEMKKLGQSPSKVEDSADGQESTWERRCFASENGLSLFFTDVGISLRPLDEVREEILDILNLQKEEVELAAARELVAER